MSKDFKAPTGPGMDRPVFDANGQFTPEFLAFERRYFEQETPFNGLMGLTLHAFEPTGVTSRLPMRPDLVGHRPTHRVHGGAISATMDVTGGFAIMAAMAVRHPLETLAQLVPRFSKISTIDLHVNYLNVSIGDHFLIHATVLRLGSRVATTRMEFMSSDGKLLASGSGAYMVA
jgi:uncharacterized protein (TIGR00369 family)